MNAQTGLASAREVLENYIASRALKLDDKQVNQLMDYCAMILRWNRLTSLVQVNSAEELVRGHIIDCLAAMHTLTGPNIVDVGSGAGLPGVVIAIAEPDWKVYLVEAKQKRTRFLAQVQIELGLDNIEICNTRIEQWRPPQTPSCITSRAFSSLKTFYSCCQHLIDTENNEKKDPDGPLLVALKGRVTDQELAELGLPAGDVTVKVLEVPGRDHRHAIMIESTRRPPAEP